jgi:hypothetical protein
MSSLLIPILVLEKIDKRRRAFFWAGHEICSGAQCLVAWEKTCTPKNNAGLGVKNLKLHASEI